MESVSAQGIEVPAIGFGTARMTGRECRGAVRRALDIGYRHVDTAQMYDNEDAVGAALADADVPREEVFLVTKLLPRNLAYDDVLGSFDASLDRLDLEYVDLLLIHAPSDEVPVGETLRAMAELRADGLVRHVGVSNFSVSQLAAAIEASEAPILTNQVEYNPFHGQADLLAFCAENDVLLTAHTPLAKGKVRGSATLARIGDRYGKTEAQVALRWLVQQDPVAAIPKAASEDHQRENLDVFDFSLSEGEMREVFELQGGPLDRLRSILGL